MSWNLGELCQVTGLASSLVEVLLGFTHETFRIRSGGVCMGTINEIFPGDDSRKIHPAERGLWLFESRSDDDGCVALVSANCTLDLDPIVEKFKRDGVEGELEFDTKEDCLCNQIMFIDSCEHWGRIPIVTTYWPSVFHGGIAFYARHPGRMAVCLGMSAFLFLDKDDFETKAAKVQRKEREEEQRKVRERLRGRSCEYMMRPGQINERRCAKSASQEFDRKAYCTTHEKAVRTAAAKGTKRFIPHPHESDDEDGGVIVLHTHAKGYTYMREGKKFVAMQGLKELEFQGHDEDNDIVFFAKYLTSPDTLIPLTDEDKEVVKDEGFNLAAPAVREDLIARFNGTSGNEEKKSSEKKLSAEFSRHRLGYFISPDGFAALEEPTVLGVTESKEFVFFARFDHGKDYLFPLLDKQVASMIDKGFKLVTPEERKVLITKYNSSA